MKKKESEIKIEDLTATKLNLEELILDYAPIHFGFFSITFIMVKEVNRNRGYGSEAMRKICDFADQNTLAIQLTADSIYGTPLPVLHKFYTKFGFEKESETSQSYLRKPQYNKEYSEWKKSGKNLITSKKSYIF